MLYCLCSYVNGSCTIDESNLTKVVMYELDNLVLPLNYMQINMKQN